MSRIKRWTSDEDHRLSALVAQGRHDPELSMALGRTKSAIKQRRCMLGLCLVRPTKPPPKPRRPKMASETVATICELIEDGLTPTTVSRRVGISVGLVEYYARREGAVGPTAKANFRPRSFDSDLITLSSDGMTKAEIARRLGLTESIVRCRLTTLARRDMVLEGVAA